VTYALCGFEFRQPGHCDPDLRDGPQRRHEVVAPGLRPIPSGTLATMAARSPGWPVEGEGTKVDGRRPSASSLGGIVAAGIRRRHKRVPRSCAPAATRSMRRQPPPRH
jgi:hypothetical protein